MGSEIGAMQNLFSALLLAIMRFGGAVNCLLIMNSLRGALELNCNSYLD
jgi:hypothetical protein